MSSACVVTWRTRKKILNSGLTVDQKEDFWKERKENFASMPSNV